MCIKNCVYKSELFSLQQPSVSQADTPTSSSDVSAVLQLSTVIVSLPTLLSPSSKSARVFKNNRTSERVIIHNP